MPDMSETAEATSLQLELRDLKNALGALRNRLETVQGDHEAALVRAASNGVAETTQLRATAAALREALETERANRERAVQAAVARYAAG